MTFVSVIIPCRNELRFIDALINTLKAQTWPLDKMEWIIADGESNDGTWERLQEWKKGQSNLTVLRNPHKFVPQALNSALNVAKGDIIVRMDAHSGYPKNYIECLVAGLLEYKADNVGGVWITKPGSDSNMALAIALATSHPLGIGNAGYRLGGILPMETDTVPYGCFRRDVFTRFGLYDVDMIRNQDDELNARIIKGGGKIVLLPDLKIDYYARPSIEKMSQMFYQYGLFKPLVNMKVGSPATWRQFAPPALFVASLLCFLALVLGMISVPTFILFVAIYLIPILAISIIIASQKGLKLFPFLLLCFPSIHFSYGYGYVMGLLKFGLLGLHKRDVANVVQDNR